MIDETIFTKLQNFGLNQYEAKAYVALLSAGTSNAYNVSKVSGIPRARIYDTLESLINRGVVMFEETSDSVKKYTAVPVNVFLEQARDKWTNTYNYIETELKAIESHDKKQDIYVSTIKGEQNIIAFCKNLIRDAKQKVIVSIWDPMYSELHTDLQACVERGCSVRGITIEVKEPLDTLDNHKMNEYLTNIGNDKWFILSVDSKHLLYGHSSEYNDNAFYTDDNIHIYLLEDYIFHDVLLNRIAERDNDQQAASKLIFEILSEMEEDF